MCPTNPTLLAAFGKGSGKYAEAARTQRVPRMHQQGPQGSGCVGEERARLDGVPFTLLACTLQDRPILCRFQPQPPMNRAYRARRSMACFSIGAGETA